MRVTVYNKIKMLNAIALECYHLNLTELSSERLRIVVDTAFTIIELDRRETP